MAHACRSASGDIAGCSCACVQPAMCSDDASTRVGARDRASPRCRVRATRSRRSDRSAPYVSCADALRVMAAAVAPAGRGTAPDRCLPRETTEISDEDGGSNTVAGGVGAVHRRGAAATPADPAPSPEIGTNTVSTDFTEGGSDPGRRGIGHPSAGGSARSLNGATASSGRHLARGFRRLGRGVLLLIARLRRWRRRSGSRSSGGGRSSSRRLHARGLVLLEVALLVLRARAAVTWIVPSGAFC